MMRSVLRTAIIAFTAGIVLGSAPGRTQSVDPSAFPSRTVKLMVPSAGGSTTDTLARIMADQLSRTWGYHNPPPTFATATAELASMNETALAVQRCAQGSAWG
jgi:hypothetical protein